MDTVKVEISESCIFKTVGPKFLMLVLLSLVTVANPLTVTLDLLLKGTSVFYVTRSDITDKVILITLQHIVFPPSQANNRIIEYKDPSQP
jgi:hypothetical protein